MASDQHSLEDIEGLRPVLMERVPVELFAISMSLVNAVEKIFLIEQR